MKKKKDPAVVWEVRARDKELHAIPKDDGFNHIPHAKCLCEPTLEGEKDDHQLFVHRVRDLAN